MEWRQTGGKADENGLFIYLFILNGMNVRSMPRRVRKREQKDGRKGMGERRE